jgi:class 3 adenylate cyclase
VLFAGLKGSMELLADRDPEEARKLLDPVLERMMEAVHRYEGTYVQVGRDIPNGHRGRTVHMHTILEGAAQVNFSKRQAGPGDRVRPSGSHRASNASGPFSS